MDLLPPPRLSMDIRSPYFDLEVSQQIGKITLDGITQKAVIGYSKPEGWLECFKQGEDGSFVIHNGGLVKERKYGVVSVEWKSR